MAKCIRCNSPFIGRRKIKLSDSYICGKCAKELGFDKGFYLYSSIYSYDDIKDGQEAYWTRRTKERIKEEVLSSVSVTMKGPGVERELVCTEEEREVYDYIEWIASMHGVDPDELRLARVSDTYLTVKYGEWDLARFKYTNKAKWIKFTAIERSDTRHGLEAPEDVQDLGELIVRSIDHIKKYS